MNPPGADDVSRADPVRGAGGAGGAGEAAVEVAVERIAVGGDGVGRDPDGRVVFVPGALPGERVVARVVETAPRWARAELVALRSADASARSARIVPPCAAAVAGCGGCGWQHMTLDAQRAAKRAMVLEVLARAGGIAAPVVVDGDALTPVGFRTTMRAHAGPDGRLAFRAARSHEVVPAEVCLVADARLDALRRAIRAVPGSEVVLRVGDGDAAGLWAPGGGLDATVVPPGVAVGPSAVVAVTVPVAAPHRTCTFAVSMPSFFQARPDGAAALVAAVGAAVADAPAGRFVDAYGGVGLFGAALAGDRPLTLVESSPSAVTDARRNLAAVRSADGASPATVVRSEVARWRPEPAAVAVADPARTGLGRGATRVLAATGAPRLVLVSCDAGSLGRDTRLLGEAGYAHRSSTLVDLFPHTPHVEVVSVFDRRPRSTVGGRDAPHR